VESHIGRINSAHDRLVKAARREGITVNFVPYDFRHTFATRMAEKGIDLLTLAALLGHDGIRCVQKYVHPTAEHKKKAMKRFDRAMRLRERAEMTRLSSITLEAANDVPSTVQ